MRLNSFKKIEAILFDFDGVIFDSEPLWFQAAINTLKSLKYNFNKDFTYKDTIGLESGIVFQLLLNKKLNNYQLKNINYNYLKESNKIFRKKLKPFLFLKSFLKKSDFKTAIVSNSDFKFIDRLLITSNLKKYFKSENIISCSKKLRPKPMPDGYLKAIKLLEVSSNNVIVIEDSENGITAAKKANITTILRFTNNNFNLSKKLKHKDIKNIASYKELFNLIT